MNAAAGLTEVRVPDLGGFKDVAVIDVLVKPGDSIAVDTPLLTLESDKAAMDVPSTVAGVIEKLHTQKGGKVSTGDLIATVKSEAAPARAPATQATTPAPPPAAPAAPAPAAPAPATPAPAAPAAAKAPAAASAAPSAPPLRTDLPPIDEPGFSRAHAGPSVRKFARELGVDLARVKGGGFKGRITHDDVKAFIKGALAGGGAGRAAPEGAKPAVPAVPALDITPFGPVESEP